MLNESGHDLKKSTNSRFLKTNENFIILKDGGENILAELHEGTNT
jgi:hypothetical protein